MKIEKDEMMERWELSSKAKFFCDRLERENKPEYDALVAEIKHRETVK